MIAKAGDDGIDGIYGATSDVRSFFNPMSDLILAIGAIVGTAGGLRVYAKWNAGEHHIEREVMGWMGACIFLELVGVIMKAMFM